MEDGSEVVMATGQVEGHSALMADVDCDGVIDVMAVDTNDDDIIDDSDCPLGGDITNDCEGCAYSGDYHFVDGECVRREK